MNSHGILEISVFLYVCILVACDAIDCVQKGDNISVYCRGDFAEFPVQFSLTLRKEANQGILAKCTEGYELRYFQSSGISRCYKFVKSPMTYEKSKNYCTADGASLVTIRNSEENWYASELAERMSGANWKIVRIGLTRVNQSSEEWVWEDGTPVNYTKWHIWEPNNKTYDSPSGESCVVISAYRWIDFSCYLEQSFICEKIVNYVPVQDKCDPGYEMRHIASTGITRCYRFSTTTKSYADAKKDCMQEGANLAVIRNKEENWFLSRNTEHWREWTFYKFKEDSEDSSLALYIGYAKHSDNWKWEIASNNTFKYWQTGYPEADDERNVKNCAILIGYMWFNVSCDVHRNYICEKIAH